MRVSEAHRTAVRTCAAASERHDDCDAVSQPHDSHASWPSMPKPIIDFAALSYLPSGTTQLGHSVLRRRRRCDCSTLLLHLSSLAHSPICRPDDVLFEGDCAAIVEKPTEEFDEEKYRGEHPMPSDSTYDV